MKEFWDQRYSDSEYVYGKKPNQFFKEFVDENQPGKILLPAEGEGRNAVYAAKMNYEVENEVLKFKLGPVSKDYDVSKVKTELIGHTYDLIFTIGIKSFGDLGDVYSELISSFNNDQVVNLDNDDKNTRFAKNNYVQKDQDSLSLMLLSIVNEWDLKLSPSAAKAFLTGISYKNAQ